MKRDILNFVIECEIYQRNKDETIKTLTSLPSLPIQTTIRTYVFIDFIIGLPKYRNKSVIMVVVDQLSKYNHFYALQQPFKPAIFAQIFID